MLTLKALWEVVKGTHWPFDDTKKLSLHFLSEVAHDIASIQKGPHPSPGQPEIQRSQCSREPLQNNQGGGLQQERRLDWMKAGGTLRVNKQVCLPES